MYEPKLKLLEKDENSKIHKRCQGRSGTFLIQGPNSCTPQRRIPIGRRNFPYVATILTLALLCPKSGAVVEWFSLMDLVMNDLQSSTNICGLNLMIGEATKMTWTMFIVTKFQEFVKTAVIRELSYNNTLQSFIIVFYHLFYHSFPVEIYLFKVNNRNTRTTCEICSKLTKKTPERRH